MLTFESEGEREFWKDVVVAGCQGGDEWIEDAVEGADGAVEALRERTAQYEDPFGTVVRWTFTSPPEERRYTNT